MAIDTAEKRRSVTHIGQRHIGPGLTPNSGQDVEWRQQAGYGYSGIDATVAPITGIMPWTLHSRSFTWDLQDRDFNWTLEDDKRT